MALVSISEASKLVKKNRTTLYKYIDNGRLSATVDEHGSKMIEFTELLRVFPDAELPHNRQQVVVENQQVSTAYQQEIDKLKQEIQHLHDVIDLKDEIISTQKHTIHVLEYKIDTVDSVDKVVEKSTKTVDKKKWWQIFKKNQ